MVQERDEGTASRRSVLQWMAVAPGAAAALLAAGCSGGGNGDTPNPDVGTDTGSTPDTGGVPDTAVAPDTMSAPDANAYGTIPEPDAGVSTDIGPEQCDPTPPDVEGPFYAPNAPNTTALATADEPGERVMINGTVYGKDCKTPLAGVIVDVWQADSTGNYHDAGTTYRLRGQMTTNEQGQYTFTSIYPGQYDVGGALRPAHIHFKFHYPGQELTTQLYFEGDPFLSPNDPCGGCNSDEASLIIPLTTESVDGTAYKTGTFDVNLQAS